MFRLSRSALMLTAAALTSTVAAGVPGPAQAASSALGKVATTAAATTRSAEAAASPLRDCAAAPVADPADGTPLDVARYRLTIGCAGTNGAQDGGDTWALDIHVDTTVAGPAFADNDVELVGLVADVDGNASNGCQGSDVAVVGGYDTDTAGFGAEVMLTPSCAETSWQYRSDAVLRAIVPGRHLQLAFTNAQIGNPTRLRWLGLVSAASETDIEYLPKSGTATLTGYLTQVAAYTTLRSQSGKITAGASTVLLAAVYDRDNRTVAGAAVELFHRSHATAGAWRLMARGTTGSDGTARFTVKPLYTTGYGLNAGAARQRTPLTVAVARAMKVTAPANGASASSPVTFRGWVYPAAAGVPIKIQYADGRGGYPTAGTLRTSSDGRFAGTVKLPAGRRAVYVSASSSDHEPSQVTTGVVVPAPRPAPAPAPRPAPQPAPTGDSGGGSGGGGGSAYYSSCANARAAGAAPLYRGQPGYRSGLDRDGDGVACESG